MSDHGWDNACDDDWLDDFEQTLFAPGPCARCGRSPAAGLAGIDGKWYCHPDTGPSCYVAESLVLWPVIVEREDTRERQQ